MSAEVVPLLLGGEWIHTDLVSDVENPATGGRAAQVATAGVREVEEAVRLASLGQPGWAARPVAERAAVLLRLADLLERDRERLAHVITSELGKPITESRGEVGGAVDFCRFFASAIRVTGGEIMPSTSATREIWTKREPVGVVAGVIPWNYPLALAARKVAPAIATGNAIVLKPSELTPLSALAFAELAIEAGVPQGVLSVLPGPGPILGPALLANPGVGFLSMTGSVRAGQSIIRNSADRIVPLSLELGGNAPFIVFDDADIESAADAAVAMRMMNCGQACVCNERTYVHASIFDEFLEALASRVGRLVVGDPLDERTEVGPKVSRPELNNVARLVDESLASGAVLVAGGRVLDSGTLASGHWYEPTILVDRSASSPAVREEIFGPVLPVVPFETEADAIRLANDTKFGLSSYFYSSDFSRVMRVSAALKTGEVFINRNGPEEVTGFHGGWGLSGLGGDDGVHGIELYQRKKSVYVDWN